MKAEKLITLSIDYEHIDISSNWVAFTITRTLEHSYNLSGITDRKSWNDFLANPFSIIPNEKIVKNHLVLIDSHQLSSLSFFKCSNNDFDLSDMEDHHFSYAAYENNREHSIYRVDYVGNKTYGTTDNYCNFYFLSDLDYKVVYFEITIDLPYLHENKDNKNVFTNLLNLLKNHSDVLTIDSSNKQLHSNHEDFIQSFENVLDSIETPYIPHIDDFSAPQPEFLNSLGTLKFNIPGFNSFNDFFEITKKYVEIDSYHLSDKKVGLIISLAVLHTYLNEIIHNDLFNLFPEEYKIAQCVALDVKLKPKDNLSKKLKI